MEKLSDVYNNHCRKPPKGYSLDLNPDHLDWKKASTADLIAPRDFNPECHFRVPLSWIHTCAVRVRALSEKLQTHWVGLEEGGLGPQIPWMLATLVARENLLLHGPPGTAKTEIGTSLFKLLGLRLPEIEEKLLREQLGVAADPIKWWNIREEKERAQLKFFHFMLSRFTQSEELFGPIEIDLLRKGVLVRVNFGLLTAPGVHAVFLDEVFKASSSVLNTLLGILNERHYFNWGAFKPSDLHMLIGATNEMPGGFATGLSGLESGGEDFSTLYAFLDRFAARIHVPVASATNKSINNVSESYLGQAFTLAIDREARRLGGYTPIEEPQAIEQMPSINDILLLSRVLLQHQSPAGGPSLFNQTILNTFRNAFLATAAELQISATDPAMRRITWSISPRKMKALYKIALAHALITDQSFGAPAEHAAGPGEQQLHVFDLIWDALHARTELKRKVSEHIHNY